MKDNANNRMGNPGNPNNTDTFRRRETHDRELDNDFQTNRAADQDYRQNLEKFSGNRCDNQAVPPTRDTTPPKCR